MPIELSFDLAVEFLSFLRVDVDNEMGDLNVVCLQGLSPAGATPTVIGSNQLSPNDNALGQYNDVVALVFRDENNEGQVASLVGTTDPGRLYTDNPLNSLGAAHLTFGQHLYVEGKHRGKRALRALNETNRIWRRCRRPQSVIPQPPLISPDSLGVGATGKGGFWRQPPSP